MVTSFIAVPELKSNCSNSSLKRLVSSVLRHTNFHWKFVSGTVLSDDECTASFDSKIEGSDKNYRLSAKVTPNGEYYAYSVI